MTTPPEKGPAESPAEAPLPAKVEPSASRQFLEEHAGKLVGGALSVIILLGSLFLASLESRISALEDKCASTQQVDKDLQGLQDRLTELKNQANTWTRSQLTREICLLGSTLHDDALYWDAGEQVCKSNSDPTFTFLVPQHY